MLILQPIWICFEHIQMALTCVRTFLLLFRYIASIQLTSSPFKGAIQLIGWIKYNLLLENQTNRLGTAHKNGKCF